MNLPKFSIDRKVTITMFMILIIILGSAAFMKLGLEMMPDITYPIVSVVTTYEGASPKDIEETITKPLETAIAGVKGIKSIKAENFENQSVLMLEFQWGTNIDFAAQDVRDAIDFVKDILPKDASKPIVLKFNLASMPILLYGVTGLENTYKLKKVLEDDIAAKLKHIDGVASIMVIGGLDAEKQIIVDKAKLEQYNISIDDIVKILYAQNINTPAGHIENRQTSYLLRTIGEYTTNEEIKNTPISLTRNGNIVYIKDVAQVVDGFKEYRGYLRTNNKPTVLFMVSKESGANTVTVAEAVKKELEIIKKDLPGDIVFNEFMDYSFIVRLATEDATSNAIMGGILAIIVMFIFLKNWRPTFAISIAIPTSIVATFIPMYLANYSLNIMTLGGLALGIGMLVDNAIVVIENIYRHLEKGDDRILSAHLGATEVSMAITASTLTTIAVFFPMAFGQGISGQLVRGLALTVAFSLFASLIVALTIVPMIASVLFKKLSFKKDYSEGKLFLKFREIYLKVLTFCLRKRALTLLIVFLFFIGSISIIPLIGTEFMPETDIPMQLFKIRLPIGTKPEETNYVVQQIEKIINNIPDVKSLMVEVGPMNSSLASSDPSNPSDYNEASIFMRLHDKDKRKRSSKEIMEEIRKKLPKLDGLEIINIDLTQQNTDENAPIIIKVFGKELDILKNINEKIIEKISSIEGLRDINNSEKSSKPEMQIIIDRDKAFRYGLTLAQISSAIKSSTIGSFAGIFREKGDEFDIRVLMNEKDRNSLETLERLPIMSPLGINIPLHQIAEIKQSEGPRKISREHQMRRSLISANVVGRDLGSVVKDIKKSIADIEKNLPQGYFIEFGGAYKNMQESFTTLFYALILAIILVYIIMASQFESFSQPFIVMFTVPLAFIGVSIALAITGTTLNIISFVGIIILCGIVVNNGIVLIDHANQLRRKENVEMHEALIQAGKDRLRPVLITAITTIVGMIPMALSTGQGSEMKVPIAITVIGGLTSATFFTLVVIPVIYSIVEHISYKTSKNIMEKLHGEK